VIDTVTFDVETSAGIERTETVYMGDMHDFPALHNVEQGLTDEQMQRYI